MTQPGDQDTGPTPGDQLLSLFQDYERARAEGRSADADANIGQLLAWAGQQAAENPTPELLLKLEADRCAEQANWNGAEAAHRRVLALAEAEDNACALYAAHRDLSDFYWLLDRHEDSLAEARAATAAARRTDLPTVLFMALDGQARSALRLGHTDEAARAVAEVLAGIEQGPLYTLTHAQALVVRAECRVASGDQAGAAADLELTWSLLAPESALTLAAGVQATLGRWWSVTARLRAARGDLPGAVGAWRQAVRRCRHVAALPHVAGPLTRNSLARYLYALGQSLRAAGDLREAEQVLDEAQALRRALGLPLPDDRERT